MTSLKYFSFIVLMLLLTNTIIYAQDKRPIFLGLQPSFTKETFYEKNEFDINILPITIQIPVAKRIDMRATSEVNYHFGPSNGISDVGIQFVIPVYLKKKEYTKSISQGFYAGPVLGLGTNHINDHNTLTLAIEPGYMFKPSKSFSLALGLQLGASYFDYYDKSNTWYSHIGVKINVGFWVNKGK